MRHHQIIIPLVLALSGCAGVKPSNDASSSVLKSDSSSVVASSRSSSRRSSSASSTADARYNMEGKETITEAKISYSINGGVLRMDFGFAVYDSSWKRVRRSGDATVDFYLATGSGRAKDQSSKTFSWRDMDEYPFGYYDEEDVRHYRYSETCSVRFDNLEPAAMDYGSGTVSGFAFEIVFNIVPYLGGLDVAESNPITCTFPFVFSLEAGGCELVSPSVCEPGFDIY